MVEKEKRSSGIEALRVVAMLMIIAYHYVVHGTAIETGEGGDESISRMRFFVGESRC